MRKKLSSTLLLVLPIAASLYIWPLLSPTMSWARFHATVEGALRKEDHPVITVTKRVLALRKEDRERSLRCGPGQSLTIIGTGLEDGDFESMLLGEGDIRFRNVKVGGSEGGMVYARSSGAATLSLHFDARCTVRGDTTSAISVDCSQIADGARIRIDNAGTLSGAIGVTVRLNSPHSCDVEVRNNGIIEGTDIGVSLSSRNDGGQANLRLVNTGTIKCGDGSAVFANVSASDGDVTLDIQNDGIIRTPKHRGLSIGAVSLRGKASVTVRNGEQGAVESSSACINAVALPDGYIRIENNGRLQSQQDGAVRVRFSWNASPGELPQGWNRDEAAKLAALQEFALAGCAMPRSPLFLRPRWCRFK